MKNEKQSTTFKNEMRYYTISNNIDVDSGEIIKNTKNYIKINKKISYERTKTRHVTTITTEWKHNSKTKKK